MLKSCHHDAFSSFHATLPCLSRCQASTLMLGESNTPLVLAGVVHGFEEHLFFATKMFTQWYDFRGLVEKHDSAGSIGIAHS